MKGYRRQQQGFSLIELMIGLTIGLFILLGVVMMYVSSARSQTTSEALARSQESGRFATYLMSREIRQAGFTGICSGVNSLLKADTRDTENVFWDLSAGVHGWSAADAPSFIRKVANSKSDVLMIPQLNRGVSVEVKSMQPAKPPYHQMHLDKQYVDAGLGQGALILAADEIACYLFQQINNSDKNINFNDTSGNKVLPGNDNSKSMEYEFSGETDLYSFSNYIYFVGGGDGKSALKRFDLKASGGGSHTDLVTGIEDMRLRYGVDTDNNNAVDDNIGDYVTADAVSDWKQVVSVQISFLTAAPGNALSDVTQTLTWPFDEDGDGKNDAIKVPSDGRLRSVFTTTVAIRNRLP